MVIFHSSVSLPEGTYDQAIFVALQVIGVHEVSKKSSNFYPTFSKMPFFLETLVIKAGKSMKLLQNLSFHGLKTYFQSYLKTYKTPKSQRNHGLKSLKLMFFPNIYFQDFQWGFPTISESRCPDVPSSLRRGPPQGVLGDDALQTRTSGKWRRPKERRL